MKLVEFPKNHRAKKIFNINNESNCDRCMQYIKIIINSHNINIILETKMDATLLKNGLHGRCFHVSFVEFYGVTFLRNTSGRLPLKHYPTGICLFKVNNKNTRTRCEICSKLTIKTPERR